MFRPSPVGADHRRHAGRTAPVALALAGVAGLVLTACSAPDAAPIPPKVTVSVLPAAGAPPAPAAAGPVTTTTTIPITTTSMPGSLEYVVQDGDTMFGIARQVGADVALLLQLNPIKDPGNLLVGQVLIVPGPPTTTAAPAAAQVVDSVPTADPTASTTWDGTTGGATDAAADATATATGSTLPAATRDG